MLKYINVKIYKCKLYIYIYELTWGPLRQAWACPPYFKNLPVPSGSKSHPPLATGGLKVVLPNKPIPLPLPRASDQDPWKWRGRTSLSPNHIKRRARASKSSALLGPSL